MPVGQNIKAINVDAEKQPAQINVSTINRVDIDWLVKSKMSENDAIPFIFQAVLRRNPTREETTKIKEYFATATETPHERLEAVYETLHLTRDARTEGIYKFQNDRLTICLGPPGWKKRPTKFGTGKDGGQLVITFERAEDENVE